MRRALLPSQACRACKWYVEAIDGVNSYQFQHHSWSSGHKALELSAISVGNTHRGYQDEVKYFCHLIKTVDVTLFFYFCRSPAKHLKSKCENLLTNVIYYYIILGDLFCIKTLWSSIVYYLTQSRKTQETWCFYLVSWQTCLNNCTFSTETRW